MHSLLLLYFHCLKQETNGNGHQNYNVHLRKFDQNLPIKFTVPTLPHTIKTDASGVDIVHVLMQKLRSGQERIISTNFHVMTPLEWRY
jgi:hypothetical protein